MQRQLVARHGSLALVAKPTDAVERMSPLIYVNDHAEGPLESFAVRR
jgi:hypothetical protein